MQYKEQKKKYEQNNLKLTFNSCTMTGRRSLQDYQFLLVQNIESTNNVQYGTYIYIGTHTAGVGGGVDHTANVNNLHRVFIV